MNEALRTAVDEAIATRRAWLAVQVDDPNNHPARHDADAKRALAESRAVARFIAWIAEEASNPEQYRVDHDVSSWSTRYLSGATHEEETHMTIIVSADGTTWVADFVDDPQVYDLFGTTVLATPFTAAVPIDEVLVKLRAVNPGCIVVHASA